MIIKHLNSWFADEIIKGGPGSGIRGHRTNRPDKEQPKGNGSFVEISKWNKLSKEDQEKIKNQVGSWSGLRRKYASGAIAAMKFGSPGIMIVKNGEIKAISSFEHIKKDKHIYIGYLATKESGHGRSMMKEICKKAAVNKYGLELSAEPTARKFYEKMGMTLYEKIGLMFRFDEKQTSKFAKTGYKGIIDDEPENGVFVIGGPKEKLSGVSNS